MAALTQTLANVGVGGSSPVESVTVGENVSQGMPGYLASDGFYYKASKASLVASKASVIFMTAASTGGKAVVAKGDGQLINLGATLTVGKTYAVGASGAIVPIEDLTTGDWKTLLGTASTTAFLKTKFDATEIQMP